MSALSAKKWIRLGTAEYYFSFAPSGIRKAASKPGTLSPVT